MDQIKDTYQLLINMTNKEHIEKITELAKPLIKYINDELDPHNKIIIENDGVTLDSLLAYQPCNEFITD